MTYDESANILLQALKDNKNDIINKIGLEEYDKKLKTME
jgi:hypothetical protein